jgi:hypothetical protein
MYMYDPALAGTAEAVSTVYPAQDQPHMCLDSLFPGSLTRAVFSCSAGENKSFTFHSLPDGKLLATVPLVDDQGIPGNSVFSPDGKTLAYSVARNDPNQEHGQIVVVPVDLSSPPRSIASVEPGYIYLEDWSSSSQLIFEKHAGAEPSVWVIHPDGSAAAKIADGFYVGLIH